MFSHLARGGGSQKHPTVSADRRPTPPSEVRRQVKVTKVGKRSSKRHEADLLMVDCPLCGTHLLLDRRMIANAPTLSPEQPEAKTAADDAPAPCPAAVASGEVHDCIECAWCHELTMRCCKPGFGGFSVMPRNGGCVGHFLPIWHDGTDD